MKQAAKTRRYKKCGSISYITRNINARILYHHELNNVIHLDLNISIYASAGYLILYRHLMLLINLFVIIFICLLFLVKSAKQSACLDVNLGFSIHKGTNEMK